MGGAGRLSKSDENSEADVSKTYSARGYGWHRFRSMRQDTLSSDPNACPLISTFSRPHSEVASTTHIPALKGSFEKALRCFLVSSKRKPPSKCSVYKRSGRGAFPAKENPPSVGRIL